MADEKLELEPLELEPIEEGEALELEALSPEIDRLEAAARSGVEGTTMGFSEELGAGAATGLAKLLESIPGTELYKSKQQEEQAREMLGDTAVPEEGMLETYRQMKAQSEARRKAGEEAYPVMTTAADIAGGMATGFGVGGKALRAGSLLGKAGKAAIAGALGGGVEMAGRSEADLTTGDIEELKEFGKDVGVGVVGGGAVGGALPIAGAGLKALGRGTSAVAKKFGKAAFGGESTKAAYQYGKLGREITEEQVAEDTAKLAQTVYDEGKRLLGRFGIDDDEIQKIADEAGIQITAGETIDDALQQAIEKRASGLTEATRESMDKWISVLQELQGEPRTLQKISESIAKKANKLELEGGEIFERTLGVTPEGRAAGTLTKGKLTEEGVKAGKKLATVGKKVSEKTLDLNNLTMKELRRLIKEVNMYTGAGGKTARLSDEAVLKEAKKLAAKLKNVRDEVVVDIADRIGIEGPDLAKKSNLISVLEEAGYGSTKGGTREFQKAKDVGAIQKYLGRTSTDAKVDQDRLFRFFGEADQPLADKLKNTTDMLDEVRQIAAREADREADISKYGLWRKAVGQGSNMLGRAMKVVTDEINKDPIYIKTLADKMAGAGKGISEFVTPLMRAYNASDRTRMAIMYGLMQQPAFRKAMVDVGEAIIPVDEE